MSAPADPLREVLGDPAPRRAAPAFKAGLRARLLASPPPPVGPSGPGLRRLWLGALGLCLILALLFWPRSQADAPDQAPAAATAAPTPVATFQAEQPEGLSREAVPSRSEAQPAASATPPAGLAPRSRPPAALPQAPAAPATATGAGATASSEEGGKDRDPQIRPSPEATATATEALPEEPPTATAAPPVDFPTRTPEASPQPILP